MANNRCSKWCKAEKMCAYCRIKDGENYTSDNYSLKNLDSDERMLLFLYACGQDISEYFDNKITPLEIPLHHSEIIDERDFSIVFDNFEIIDERDFSIVLDKNGYKTD